MQFAPVSPIAWMSGLHKWGMQSGTYLLLAHDVLAKPEQYQKYFCPWPEGTTHVIMDNSVVEIGKPLPFADVIEAARIVNADIVVAPDVMYDSNYTIHTITRCYREILEARENDELGIMYVVQGNSEQEFLDCAERMLSNFDVDWFAIPRLAQHVLKTRYNITERIARHGKPIHLLGFSNDTGDDIYTGWHVPEVYSVDSALPIWYGVQGKMLDHHPTRNNAYGRRPPNFFGLGNDGGVPPIESILNTQICRLWVQRGV